MDLFKAQQCVLLDALGGRWQGGGDDIDQHDRIVSVDGISMERGLQR